MGTVQMCMQHFVACWFLLYSYFPDFLLANPLNYQETNVMTEQSQCTLKHSYFLQSAMRRNIYSVALQAQLLDSDTDNKIFGNDIFFNILENDYCFLMKKIVRYIMENVIFDGFQNYIHMEDVIIFLDIVDKALEECHSENEEQVNMNIEIMKSKIEMLGPNGKNKVIGELNLIFRYLKRCINRQNMT